MPQNDYGVYQETEPTLWVKETIPSLILSSADQAKTWSEVEAMTVATYLSQGGTEFKVGRPNDRVPH